MDVGTIPDITDMPTGLHGVIGTMDEIEVRVGIEAKVGTEAKTGNGSKVGIETAASAAETAMSVVRIVKVHRVPMHRVPMHRVPMQ